MARTTRLDSITAYPYTNEKHAYLVTLERLPNDRNGNGRRKAVVVICDNFGLMASAGRDFYNAVYTFGSDGRGDKYDVEKAVRIYEGCED